LVPFYGPQCNVFFHTLHKIVCLQLEASNDTEENTASDISSKSHDADNNGMPTVRQVSNFVSGSFVIQPSCDSVFISVAQFTKSGSNFKQ